MGWTAAQGVGNPCRDIGLAYLWSVASGYHEIFCIQAFESGFRVYDYRRNLSAWRDRKGPGGFYWSLPDAMRAVERYVDDLLHGEPQTNNPDKETDNE